MSQPQASAQNGAASKAEYPGKLISAASIASPFQTDISASITKRKARGMTVPKLIGILATPSPPSVAYAEWTKKACEQVGIHFEIWRTWQEEGKTEDVDGESMEGVEGDRANTDLEADVEDLIIAANADESVHGIMVYYPIFGGRQDTYLQQIVDPRKDVEGLHFSYCWNMYHNVRWILPSQLGGAPGTTTEAQFGPVESDDVPPGFAKSILPCTSLAIVKCLEAMGVYDGSLPYGDRLYGKTITVVNRSEVVGRPLAALLSNDGARVLSVDLDSIQEFNKRAPAEKDRKPSEAVMRAREQNAKRRLRTHHIVRPCAMTMQQCIESSDVVISGVPSAKFKIDTDWIREGAVTVNFSSEKNFDKDIRRRSSKHLPAIGKTTIAMLQRNLLRLVQYRELNRSSSFAMTNGSNHNDDLTPGASGPSFPSDKSHREGNSNAGPSSGGCEATPAARHSDGGSGTGHTAGNNLSSQPAQTFRSSFTGIPGFASHRRFSVMSLSQSDSGRDSVSKPAQISPIHPQPTNGVSHPPMLWDWRSNGGRRESSYSASTIASPLGGARQGGSSGVPSPLLFAPVSPFQHSNSSHSSSTIPARPTVQRSNSSNFAPSSPRSATPVSPLFIDGLSVEDGPYGPGNASGMRGSWDSSAPRTPREEQILPTVLERSTKEMPQRVFRGFPSPSPKEEVMTMASSHPPSVSSHLTSDRIAHTRRRRRPPFSYSSLIAQAISSSPEGRMTLREIYTWISNAYPDLYSMEGSEGSGWQNTVRHNLSLNKSFVKVARTAQDIYESCSSGVPSQSQAARGKGGWWTLDYPVAREQLGPNFRGEHEYGDGEFMEETGKRRRRTASYAASAPSDEEPLSPSESFVPSVLRQHIGSSSANNQARQAGATGISLLMSPSRPLSAGRVAAAAEHAGRSAGRVRGYTTGDADPSVRQYTHQTISTPSVFHQRAPSPLFSSSSRHSASAPYTLTSSPGKRKLPFHQDSHMHSPPRSYRANELALHPHSHKQHLLNQQHQQHQRHQHHHHHHQLQPQPQQQQLLPNPYPHSHNHYSNPPLQYSNARHEHSNNHNSSGSSGSRSDDIVKKAPLSSALRAVTPISSSRLAISELLNA